MFSGKKILIGITGAIAAYKILELIRMLKKNNADVKVILTPNALNFVTETTIRTLSQNKVYMEQFSVDDYKPEHISLVDEADVFLIAPATANTIGKIANGICDNLLTSVFCAFKKDILIAPCMNTNMWGNANVQRNIKTLKDNGIKVIEPEVGFLACNTTGKGRLANINIIFDEVKNVLIPKQNLKGKKFIITAGGTKEEIDPVRYIGNYSSGKMGTALADAVYKRGGEVCLITTKNVVKPYKTIIVKSAEEMLFKVEQEFDNTDTLIMAAAVSDYKVANKSSNKIKKTGKSITLELLENPDILKIMSMKKKENQTVIGFCAESENLEQNAKIKIETKKCDYIIANDISKKDIGFSSDYNEVYIVSKDNIITLEKNTKEIIAEQIIENIYG